MTEIKMIDVTVKLMIAIIFDCHCRKLVVAGHTPMIFYNIGNCSII